jgi:hypothetical protein
MKQNQLASLPEPMFETIIKSLGQRGYSPSASFGSISA